MGGVRERACPVNDGKVSGVVKAYWCDLRDWDNARRSYSAHDTTKR